LTSKIKTIFSALFPILLFILLGLNNPNFSSADAPGSIWTTDSCPDGQQDTNRYYQSGDQVYIRGHNFDPDTYDWNITGQPGEASCHPNQAVASGQHTVISTDYFCFLAYTIGSGDCGEYKFTFGKNKSDNYHISGSGSTSTPNPTNIPTSIPTIPPSDTGTPIVSSFCV